MNANKTLKKNGTPLKQRLTDFLPHSPYPLPLTRNPLSCLSTWTYARFPLTLMLMHWTNSVADGNITLTTIIQLPVLRVSNTLCYRIVSLSKNGLLAMMNCLSQKTIVTDVILICFQLPAH